MNTAYQRPTRGFCPNCRRWCEDTDLLITRIVFAHQSTGVEFDALGVKLLCLDCWRQNRGVPPRQLTLNQMRAGTRGSAEYRVHQTVSHMASREPEDGDEWIRGRNP